MGGTNPVGAVGRTPAAPLDSTRVVQANDTLIISGRPRTTSSQTGTTVESSETPKATGSGGDIYIKTTDGTQIAEIDTDTGLSWDAVLKIKGGGKYKFIEKNHWCTPDKLNTGHFETENGRVITDDAVASLRNIITGDEVEVKTSANGTMRVKTSSGNFVPFEKWVLMQHISPDD